MTRPIITCLVDNGCIKKLGGSPLFFFRVVEKISQYSIKTAKIPIPLVKKGFKLLYILITYGDIPFLFRTLTPGDLPA